MNDIMLLILILWPMFGALLVVLFGQKKPNTRFNIAIFVAVIEMAIAIYLFYQLFQYGDMSYTIDNICGMTLTLKLDGMRVVYGLITAFMWLNTTGYTKEYLASYGHQTRYLFFTLITCGATAGVFLSSDLFTTFIFFEIMSFASYVMVIHDQKPDTMYAGQVYLAIAVIGGLAMLMGIFMLYSEIGTLQFDQLSNALTDANMNNVWLAAILILVGFGGKAGLFPLHVWLPKAHPVAPAPASALLSGILTKCGVFGMIVISMELFKDNVYWAFMLLVLAIITMVLGAVLALFSDNIKRTLACSSMSQIGFITIGLAMSIFLGSHNTIAVRGLMLHMVNHSFIKLLLFMIAGVIYINTHHLDLNKIRGFGRNKWFIKILFFIGACAIMGIPLFSGYISKTLLHESIVEYIHLLHGSPFTYIFQFTEYLFLFSGGLTCAYMIKLFVCVFIEKNADASVQAKYDQKTSYIQNSKKIYFILSVIPLILIGLFPNVIANPIMDLMQTFMHAHALEHPVDYFAWINLKGAVISITLGILIYIFIVRMWMMKKESTSRIYINKWPKWLDIEKLIYRPLVFVILPFIFALICRIMASITDWLVSLMNHTILKRQVIMATNASDLEPGELIPNYRVSKSLDEIENSLSYGLLLFGLGVCICLIYMLSTFF